MSEPDVSIDTREPKSGKFVAAIMDAGYVPRLEALPTFDFVIHAKHERDIIGIERKDASDFLGSIEGKKNEDGTWDNGRIWDQLKRMKDSGVENRWIVLEGDPFSSRLTAYRKKGFDKVRIWGAMEGIAKWGCNIIRTRDEDETMEWIIHLIKKQDTPKKAYSLRTSAPHEMTLKEKKLYLLQGLPGVGPKTSAEILKEHDTVMDFFKKIEKSSCLGDKSKKEIGKILN